MFIWPDSIPPGAEYIIIGLLPLSVLTLTDDPLFAAVQFSILVSLLLAVVVFVRFKKWSNFWLVLLLPIAYVLGTFSSNFGWLLLSEAT